MPQRFSGFFFFGVVLIYPNLTCLTHFTGVKYGFIDKTAEAYYNLNDNTFNGHKDTRPLGADGE